ncbi:MAG: hypothetical protein ACFFD7_04435 [Candidatus Thorarchaeota archaeon]
MGEYGNDWDDELDSHEINKDLEEIKGEASRSEELDEKWYPNKEIEDAYDELNNFTPKEEIEDPFDEFVLDRELEDKLDDGFDEYNNFNPNEEFEDLIVENANQDLVPDNKNDYLENIENKSNDHNFDKDFIEGIDKDIKKKKQDMDFIECVEYELKQSESKGIAFEPQKDNRIDEIDFDKSKEYIDEIKEYLKQVNWSEISKDWKIQVYVGSNYKTISLNPYQDCSKSNPLYKHEKWLKWVYTNKELNLNDISIAKICGNINNKTIGNWREMYDIPRKEFGNYIKNGYRFLYMPKEYKHPEFNPIGEKRIYRPEHIVVMEDHLNKVLTSEESSRHPCLIKNDDKYYIKNGSIVHHINHIRIDNRIENLWLYKNDREHHNSNLNECLSSLIKLNQVSFSDGNYYLNLDYDYRNFNIEKINEKLEQRSFINYEDLDKVKETIKNMDWSGMDWSIEYKIRNNAPIEKIQLNPYEDCSDTNPLYRHKGWIERIVRNKRFNLTDSRLSDLCGISERTARRYRGEKHRIPAEYRGYDRYIGKNSSGKKIIYIKLDKSYGNPFAVEKANSIQMREHRYIMEKHLAQEPELNKDYLINNKYLKKDCQVHHINLDKLDNKLENLYPCENSSEHNTVHSSLIKLIDEMMKSSLIMFENGKYFLDI